MHILNICAYIVNPTPMKQALARPLFGPDLQLPNDVYLRHSQYPETPPRYRRLPYAYPQLTWEETRKITCSFYFAHTRRTEPDRQSSGARESSEL